MIAATDYRGRFAPSPTGSLHFGSLVAAVASYAEARHQRGVWIVRMEDLDTTREVPGAAAAILSDLALFGMQPGHPVMFQSQRTAAYEAALATLMDNDLAYPCGCTRAELPASGIYPGTCASGLPAGKVARSVRVRVRGGRVGFEDRIMGRFQQDLARDVGDFIVRRADGLFAYQLAVVVDDATQGISDIVRGSDLLDSTPRQIYLQRLLDLPTPGYAHVPLAVDAAGRKLSKQCEDQPVSAADPLPGLLAAWSFLGQARPPLEDRGSVSRFWRWAGRHWQMASIPKQASATIQGQ